MNAYIIDPENVRDLRPLLAPNGSLVPVPASVMAQFTQEERAVFGVKNAYYGLLTLELIAHLKSYIGDRTALEIGAGAGSLARALGIRATDNKQQARPDIKAYYQALHQPTITYGKDVEELDALSAVRKYRPQVVLASWVTHKYDPRRHQAGGNADGVCEEDILASCEEYIFIGNEKVHKTKSIWTLPHQVITPDWLFSRAMNGSRDFIATWKRSEALPLR